MCLRGDSEQERKLNLQARPINRRNYRHNANEATKQESKNQQGERQQRKKQA